MPTQEINGNIQIEYVKPAPQYVGTKTAIEAIPGVLEGAIAYASDTNEFGSYDGATWTWGSGGVTTFLGLTDTPADYTGDANKVVSVKATEDGLEFVTLSGGGDMLKSIYDTNDNGIVDAAESVAWSGITGVPSGLLTEAPIDGNQYGRQDGTWTVISGVASSGVTTFLELTDTPDSYTTFSGYVVAVKPTEDGLEFIPMASGGGSPTGAAGGDLSGTYPNPYVKGASEAFYLSPPLTFGVTNGTTYNDWNPTGLETTSLIILTNYGITSATITGITAPSPATSKALAILNQTDGIITFPLESTSSSPANRIQASHLNDGLYAGEAALLIYDTSTSRWKIIASVRDNIIDTMITMTDVSNANVSTAMHGFMPKAPNNASQIFNGTATWTDIGPVIHNTTVGGGISDTDETIFTTTAEEAYKMSWSTVKSTIGSALGAIINALTGKTTPVDADELVIGDSAAANASKKLTWANLKATLKTYFDTLYAATFTLFSDAEGDPANVGTTADGTSTYAARRDHVHAQGGTAGGDLTGTYPNPTVNIDGKTSKATPVDADETFLADSAASFATKKLTINNLRIFLANYFLSSADGWVTDTNTWTRTGNYTFTIAGNYTSTFRKGTKVTYNDGTTEFGVVLSSSYSAPNTTVTLFTNDDYAMAAATLTNTKYSHIENPSGFPDWFNYTPTYSGSGSMTYTTVTTNLAKFTVRANTVFYVVNATGTTGGTADTTLRATGPTTPAQSSVTPGASATRDATSGNAVVGTGGANSTNGIFTRKADSSNYALSTGRLMQVSGFFEY